MAPALPRHLSHFPRTESSFGWASSNCELLSRMLTCCKRVCQSPLDNVKPAIARLVLNALYRDWILRAALCSESVSDIKELRIAARSAKPDGYVSWSRRQPNEVCADLCCQVDAARASFCEACQSNRDFSVRSTRALARTHTRVLTKLAHLAPCT